MQKDNKNVRRTLMKQRVFRMYLGNNDGTVELNKLLEDGWFVKEWHVSPCNDDGGYAIYLLEKK